MTSNPRLIGRILALLYLVLIISGVYAQGFVSNRLIDFSSAATTANNILAHKGLFQLGFTVFLIEMAQCREHCSLVCLASAGEPQHGFGRGLHRPRWCGVQDLWPRSLSCSAVGAAPYRISGVERLHV